MASNRNPRTPRIGDIPQDYMLNWQCPSAEGLSTLVRRPMTACEACRATKAKCDGQQACQRCTTRGIACRYPTTKSTSTDPARQSHSRRSSTEAWGSLHQAQSDDENASSSRTVDVAGDESITDSMKDTRSEMSWMNDLGHQELDFLDWSPEIVGMSQDSQNLDLSPPMSRDDLDLVQSLTEQSLPRSLLQTTPAYRTSMHATETHSLPSSPADLPYSVMMGPFSAEPCFCRAGPVLLGPKIRRAMQSKRFDELLKVTGDAIKSCQRMIDCGNCQLSSPDLICAITVFQETSACFKQITKPDSSSVVKLIVGGYEVAVTDRNKLRSVLVMDLVKQANCLLDSLSNLGENMFLTRPAPDRLAQVHLDYLRALIQDFRDTLRLVTDSMWEVDSQGAG
ncbi:hypothetical protein F4781DRAFT_126968 [Annulohypoxylon bovei var. microspora]|nr:hypothetical protein F4781DRAFT_126968 [Annulohypoxylon bovei var. microspora]